MSEGGHEGDDPAPERHDGMTFEFEHYVLRKPRDDDAQGFFDIAQDPEAMQFYGEVGAGFTTLEEAHQQVVWCQQQFAAHAGKWIITEKGQDTYIGDIGFSDFVERHNRVELGYRLCRAYWGQGIITNFIRVLVHWGFTELGYNRIEALVDTRNAGSKIVLLNNHFQLEGTLREYEFEHGHFVDLEMYALLRSEYCSSPWKARHIPGVGEHVDGTRNALENEEGVM